jgi:hypothetical protein
MTAAENIAMAPHLDHFARGYRLRHSGNTPALTKSRMVNNRRTWSKRSLDTAVFLTTLPSEQDRVLYHSNDHE